MFFYSDIIVITHLDCIYFAITKFDTLYHFYFLLNEFVKVNGQKYIDVHFNWDYSTHPQSDNYFTLSIYKNTTQRCM